MSEWIYPEINAVEQYALQFLIKGREGWDVPHTRAVVYHAGQIAISKRFDFLLFTTTAWLHDIGYHDLFQSTQSSRLDQVMDRKTLHMIRGAKMAQEFLLSPKIKRFYTDEQRQDIIFLVATHDDLTILNNPQLSAFREADTLGMIDLSRVTPTFDRETLKGYLTGELRQRAEMFSTPYGISQLNILLPAFIQNFNLTPWTGYESWIKNL